MSVEVKKEYTNGEITVVWKPGLCTHSAICVQTLPNVYKPKEKPWIQIENGTTEALQAQVSKCPSGALTYYMNNESQPMKTADSNVKIEIINNGPAIITGGFQVEDKTRNIEDQKDRVAICRCGLSGNKPYCDGSHRENAFE